MIIGAEEREGRGRTEFVDSCEASDEECESEDEGQVRQSVKSAQGNE